MPMPIELMYYDYLFYINVDIHFKESANIYFLGYPTIADLKD
jgi:hypothetical protein